jgi:hypothetical protein
MRLEPVLSKILRRRINLAAMRALETRWRGLEIVIEPDRLMELYVSGMPKTHDRCSDEDAL